MADERVAARPICASRSAKTGSGTAPAWLTSPRRESPAAARSRSSGPSIKPCFADGLAVRLQDKAKFREPIRTRFEVEGNSEILALRRRDGSHPRNLPGRGREVGFDRGHYLGLC